MNSHHEQVLPYTANLLGTIKSHLAGLQGYGVMILELLQNADDAKAEKIIFDITDTGLYLFNSGEFSYCGNLASPNCLTEEESCDFHRIKEVASGGKLGNPNNIGRFGIGFVSTYQITDTPEIKSNGIKLKLLPEKGQSIVETIQKESGSSFFLPWAFDQTSHARQALNLSAINNNDIQEITNSFLSVVRHSLLFLRHVKNVLIKINGNTLLECTIDRSIGNEFMIEFQPDDIVEMWHILRANAASKMTDLFDAYPQLEQLQRNTDISIAIRIEPKPLEKGLLYAYLPTEQRTQLPLHINADFFPESDRKSIIFSGKHERAWNEALVEEAAKKIAEFPTSLLQIMGQMPFWKLLENAYLLHKSPEKPSASFDFIWRHLKQSCCATKIIPNQKSQLQKPSDLWFISTAKISKQQQDTLHKIGVNLVSEELDSFSIVYRELGCKELTFAMLLNYLSNFFVEYDINKAIPEHEINSFYKPLWAIIEHLLPNDITIKSLYGKQLDSLQQLQQYHQKIFANTKLFFTTNNKPISLNAAYKANTSLTKKIQRHLPNISIINAEIEKFPRLAKIVRNFNLDIFVENLKKFDTDDENLKSLYSMIVTLESDSDSCEKLKDFTIWKTGDKLSSANNILIPGDFTDPTGQANLLDMTIISDDVKNFLLENLSVKKQNIQEFIKSILPKFFSDHSNIDLQKYKKLITELDKNQQKLINDLSAKEMLKNILLVPTLSGDWKKTQAVYRRTSDLIEVLGDNSSLWLDEQKIPSEETVKNFISSLGLLTTPKPDDLINRILQIAKDSRPIEQSVKICATAFYFLCKLFKEKRINSDNVSRLKNQKCFPAKNDSNNWYMPTELHAPYRAEGFESQTKIIAFSDASKLEKEMLNVIGIKTEPSTEIVINHLLSHIESNEKPHKTTYTILNERSEKDGGLIKQKLSNKSCIYIDGWSCFAFPYEIYWDTVVLGKYAITIPDGSHEYKKLFDALGVEKQPKANDYIRILQKMATIYYNTANSITDDLAVYNKCICEINASFTDNSLSEDQIKSLAKHPIIINLHKEFIYPADALLLDSPWHVTNFFENELDQALCNSNHEAWSLFEKIGANRISQSISIDLDYSDGNGELEESFTSWWKNYESIILRLTNEYSNETKKTLSGFITDLSVYDYNLIKIVAEAKLSTEPVKSEPKSVNAFFDKHQKTLLIVKRERTDWLDIFNSFFYQILPYKTAEEISKLSLLLDSVREKNIQQAHIHLDKAGIAAIRSHEAIEGIESEKIEVFANDESSSDEIKQLSFNKESSIENQPTKEAESTEIPKNSNSQKSMNLSDFKNLIQERKEQEKKEHQEQVIEKPTTYSSSANHSSKMNNSGITSSDHNWHDWNANNPDRDRGTSSATSVKNTATKQRNQQLRSYVLPSHEADRLKEGSEEKRKHNLAVEALSREIVCRYERQKGRIPEEMPQAHPGYDIRSIDVVTGEERLIEVKGISGDWNHTGVGLSRLQFSNAQDYGETYWLYVVDHISKPMQSTVYPICNPAMKVNTFMFDEGWKNVVTIESNDPILAFIPTTKIHHEQWGSGLIKAIAPLHGNDRSMQIEFEQHGERTLSFSLHISKMKVLID